MGIEALLAKMGYTPQGSARNIEKDVPGEPTSPMQVIINKIVGQGQPFASSPASAMSPQSAKRQKDQMDFYRTSREYLPPSQAYEATKRRYPDFDQEFKQSGATVEEERDNIRLAQEKARLAATDLRRQQIESLQAKTRSEEEKNKALTQKYEAQTKKITDQEEPDQEEKPSSIAKRQILYRIQKWGEKSDPYAPDDIDEFVRTLMDRSPTSRYFDIEDKDISAALKAAYAKRTGKNKTAEDQKPASDFEILSEEEE